MTDIDLDKLEERVSKWPKSVEDTDELFENVASGGNANDTFDAGIEHGVELTEAENRLTILALIARVRDAEQRMPCDGGCSYNDGPDETCSAHGRPVAQVWGIANNLGRERSEWQARAEAAEQRLAEQPDTEWEYGIQVTNGGVALLKSTPYQSLDEWLKECPLREGESKVRRGPWEPVEQEGEGD